jgi:hypothetical protein
MTTLNTPNYGGRQNNNSSYIKTFVVDITPNLWNLVSYPNKDYTSNTLTPSSLSYDNVLIQGDLYVNGSIINPSDANLKDNIADININHVDKLMNLDVKQFIFKNDLKKQIHYGFIAQEFEKEFPELVSIKPDKNANYKAINYLEIVPLLVNKIQQMQEEIDELKNKIGKLDI